MSLTILQREAFQGIGTLNAANPGNLGTVQGNWFKRAVGPRVITDTSANSNGWSADLSGQGNPDVFYQWPASVLPPNQPVSSGGKPTFFEWALYLDAPTSNYHVAKVGNNFRTLDVYLNGTTVSVSGGGDGGTVSTNTTFSVPLRAFVRFRMALQQTSNDSNFTHDFAFQARLANSSTWTTIYASTGQKYYGTVATAKFGFFDGGGGAAGVRARWGMASVYRADSWADLPTLDANVVDTATGPFTWYVNPVSGSDNNDGATPQTAWKSETKVTAESRALGIFGRAGNGNGDRLSLDLSGGDWRVGYGDNAAAIHLFTQGIVVTQTGSGWINGAQDISGAGWTQTSGTTVVWQKALTGTPGNTNVTAAQANVYSALWENDAPMAHLNGSQLSDVQAGLVSTANSFFCDGSNAYIHPSDGSNPNTSGKTYERSLFRDTAGGPIIAMDAPDWTLINVLAQKSTVCRNTDSDPASSYCYQTYGNSGGTCLMQGCVGRYGSKHVLGFTDLSTTRQYTVRDCQMDMCSAYATYFGATSVYVDYTQTDADGTAVSNYVRCKTVANMGLIGSTTGTNLYGQPIWLSHAAGTHVPIAQVNFTNCDFGVAPLLTYGDVKSVNFQGGRLWGAQLGTGTHTFNGVTLTSQLPSPTGAGATVAVTNCVGKLFVPSGNGFVLNGPLTVTGCTFDISAAFGAILTRTGPTTLIWRNNAVVGGTIPTFANFTSADSITADHNAYPAGSYIVASQYKDSSNTTADRTFAQWQTLGFGAGSITPADPMVDAQYRPLTGSPLIGAGAVLGTFSDFSGTRTRNSMGAYEPASGTTRGGFFF